MSAWTVTKDGNVAVLTMSKPPLNLVYTDDIIEMGERLADLRADPEVRAVVMTGEGRAFIGGADVSQFTTFETSTIKFGLHAGQRVLRDMEEMEKPVLAAINGFAFGGGLEIALACDIRIASDAARFGQLEINYGIMPGWGGTQRLVRVVGLGRAKDLVLTGRIVEPAEAYQMGLVSRVVPAADLMDEAMELAGLLASKAPVAMALAKEVTGAAAECTLDVGTAMEASACAITMGTEDCVEGVRAFMEKRKPEFKGR